MPIINWTFSQTKPLFSNAIFIYSSIYYFHIPHIFQPIDLQMQTLHRFINFSMRACTHTFIYKLQLRCPPTNAEAYLCSTCFTIMKHIKYIFDIMRILYAVYDVLVVAFILIVCVVSVVVRIKRIINRIRKHRRVVWLDLN